MKRQPDGTFRSVQQSLVVSQAVLRGRWVQAEAIRLKIMGFTFDEIAEQISRIGHGQAQAIVTIPEGVTFPTGYSISRQACHKAFTKAIAKLPAINVEELRKVDNARSEEMFLNLQPGIRKGNPRAIEVGIRVLGHAAKINGYAAPQKHELTGKNGKPLTLVQMLNCVGDIPDEE